MAAILQRAKEQNQTVQNLAMKIVHDSENSLET
jgi:hypothetical protein